MWQDRRSDNSALRFIGKKEAAMKNTMLMLALAVAANLSLAEEIGSVDTAFKLIGPDHKVVVEAFDDPSVQGIACYVSMAKTGGLKGAFGFAKDPSRYSIACRQVGPLHFSKPLPRQEEVFKESASFIFKHVRVVRIVDKKRNALAYLTYSDKLIEGSPDNAITAVPVMDQTIPSR